MLVPLLQQNLQSSVPAGTRHDERYGLILDAQIAQKNASKAIAALAIQQVDKPAKTAKRNRQLRRELDRSGVQWNAFYAGLLTQARGQVLTEQIRAQFNDQRLEALALQQQIAGLVAEQIRMDDDDEALALLLCL